MSGGTSDEIDVEVYHEMTTKRCMNLPIHKFLGLKLISQNAGQATAEYIVGTSHENTSGMYIPQFFLTFIYFLLILSNMFTIMCSPHL